MRIAIVGAGLAGLAATWHLSNFFSVTLFDSKGIGGGASGIAAGLMHPFSGAHAQFNRHGFEGMQATLRLLDIASNALKQPVADFSGLLRPVTTLVQQKNYAFCSSQFSEHVQWWTQEKCQHAFPSLQNAPGIFIPCAVKVNCPAYLKGLWKACENRGARFIEMNIFSMEELKDFDAIVAATGAGSKHICELSHLKINTVKGQLLELEWPANMPPLPFSLNSQAYLLSHFEHPSCYAGSTFERNALSIEPDIEIAKQEIFPKLAAMIPQLQYAKVIGCQSAFRVSTPTRLPIAEKIKERLWIFTGMGSKGLLYHALYAEKLAAQIRASLCGTQFLHD